MKQLTLHQETRYPCFHRSDQMKNNEIPKWRILYYWILTYIRGLKKIFKGFTKKGREELAYEKKRLDQIHEMILHHTDKNEPTDNKTKK